MVTCKQCGGLVRWVKIQGRFHCHNANGSDHWDTCSQRRWRQVVSTGTRFEEKHASGYRNSIHGTKFDRKSAGVMPGKVKRSGLCKDCVPPWERCPNQCPDEIKATT